MKRTAQPIADIVHAQLRSLEDEVGPETVEQAALAMIAGAGRWLLEQSPNAEAALRIRILRTIATQSNDAGAAGAFSSPN